MSGTMNGSITSGTMGEPTVFVEAVKKTLSEMAFVDVEPTATPAEPLKVSHISHISYDGPERGEIEMALPLSCKRRFVENIYGDDWERLDPEEIDDCLLEIINVLAGEYLSEQYGDGIQRELSLPRLIFDRSAAMGNPDVLFFDAEGEVFQIYHAHSKGSAGHDPLMS